MITYIARKEMLHCASCGRCRFGGFCDNVDMFDANLFKMTYPEADATDPQQRILLEETFIAIEATRADVNESTYTHTGAVLHIDTHSL